MAPNAESVEVAETANFLRGTEPAEFDKLKGKVLKNLNEMIASVTNANMFNEDAMKNLDQQICAANNTFFALCANQPLEFDIKKFVNSNQNTVRQSTFFLENQGIWEKYFGPQHFFRQWWR